MLARTPEKITIADILDCVAGKHLLLECTGNPNTCPRAADCLAAPFWSAIQNVLDTLIAGITIADLVEPDRRQALIAQLQQCRQQYQQATHNPAH